MEFDTLPTAPQTLFEFNNVPTDLLISRLGAYHGSRDGMWLDLTNSLNAVGDGPHKQSKDWQKTWRDWKSNVLKKCAKNKSYGNGTGGGPPKVLPLSELEEALLEVIDPESAGLNKIREGGSFDRILLKQGATIHGPVNPEGGSFDRLKPSKNVKRSSQVNEKTAHSPINKRIRLPSVTWSDEIYQIPDIYNAASTSTADLGLGNQLGYSTFTPLEVDDMNDSNGDENIDEMRGEINILSVPEKIPGGQNQPKATPKRRTNRDNAGLAVDLMEKKLQLLEQQVALNENSKARMLEIEEEKLRLKHKNYRLKKEMFEHIKTIHSEIIGALSDISNNVIHMRGDIEKIAPSYLE